MSNTTRISVAGPTALVPLTEDERQSLTVRALITARLRVSQDGLPVPVRLESVADYLGFSATTIRAWCNGRSVPRAPLADLVMLSRRLGVTCEELMRTWVNTQDEVHGTGSSEVGA
jgi:transcriptional regulator with XRE-family HTH domain